MKTTNTIIINGQSHELDNVATIKILDIIAQANQDRKKDIFDQAEFDAVFTELSEHNTLHIIELRSRLNISREEFDKGIMNQMKNGRYWMSTVEGRFGITPEEREAELTVSDEKLAIVHRKK